MKKLILTALFLGILVFAKTSPVQASGIEVTATNSQGLTSGNLSDYKGNIAGATITVTNKNTTVKKIWIDKQWYSCDSGSPVPCFQRGKSAGENITLNPGQTIKREISQSTPQPTCGSAQVDFFVTDITDGVRRDRQGPFWGFAYTGRDCVPTLVCPPTPGASLSNGKTWDVGYADGWHWIVGKPHLKRGADYVYYLGPATNPKTKALQCFYPKNEDRNNIQTDWKVKGALSLLPGWILVNNGADFGLLPVAYLAKNTLF